VLCDFLVPVTETGTWERIWQRYRSSEWPLLHVADLCCLLFALAVTCAALLLTVDTTVWHGYWKKHVGL